MTNRKDTSDVLTLPHGNKRTSEVYDYLVSRNADTAPVLECRRIKINFCAEKRNVLLCQ